MMKNPVPWLLVLALPACAAAPSEPDHTPPEPSARAARPAASEIRLPTNCDVKPGEPISPPRPGVSSCSWNVIPRIVTRSASSDKKPLIGPHRPGPSNATATASTVSGAAGGA